MRNRGSGLRGRRAMPGVGRGVEVAKREIEECVGKAF
jgi:hypothetical protein